MVDGETIAENVPATALLGLETKLKELRRTYEAIPNLQPGVKWEAHLEKENIFVAANPEVKTRTEKVMEPVVLYEATDKHPAQVKEASKDIVIGTFTIDRESGMISSARKSALLGRIDKLIRAVKKARMEANGEEVVEKISIGKALHDFIHA